MDGTTKVTVNLPDSVVEDLRKIAEAGDTTLTDALRRSIQINKFLLDEEKKNSKLLIERADGKLERVIRK